MEPQLFSEQENWEINIFFVNVTGIQVNAIVVYGSAPVSETECCNAKLVYHGQENLQGQVVFFQ